MVIFKSIVKNDMNLEQKIEAILFWKGEPITVKKLSQIVEASAEEVNTSLNELEKTLAGRGIVLMRKEDEVTFGTNPQISGIIEALTKEDLNRDLGKAGLETLSIVLYKGPIKRTGIDYIRGVNSSFILRNLLVRGLVERVVEGRGYLYKPTFELLSFLGIKNVQELPDYDKVKEEIKAFEESANEGSLQTNESEVK